MEECIFTFENIHLSLLHFFSSLFSTQKLISPSPFLSIRIHSHTPSPLPSPFIRSIATFGRNPISKRERPNTLTPYPSLSRPFSPSPLLTWKHSTTHACVWRGLSSLSLTFGCTEDILKETLVLLTFSLLSSSLSDSFSNSISLLSSRSSSFSPSNFPYLPPTHLKQAITSSAHSDAGKETVSLSSLISFFIFHFLIFRFDSNLIVNLWISHSRQPWMGTNGHEAVTRFFTEISLSPSRCDAVSLGLF